MRRFCLSSPGSPLATRRWPPATNRITTVGGANVQYDNSGNVLADGSHYYAWDAYGHPVNVDGSSVTYDALGRMVENNNGGTYKQIVYSPTGAKLALMNGQTLTEAFVSLPGGGQAVYNSSGLLYYGHTDHLGSIKLGSTPSRGVYFDLAYAPFGEIYTASGAPDTGFTGMRSDTAGGLYDFPAREYSFTGRWSSPDPAGLAAVDPSNPQSWNRYAYVLNNPMAMVDPNGLDPCQGANSFPFSQAADGTGIFTPEDCAANGGTWGSSGNDFFGPGGGGSGDPGPGYGNPTPGCTLQYDDNGNLTGIVCDPQNSGGGAGPQAPKHSSGGGTTSAQKPTISPGPPDGKKNYCSHQADLAALEELLPGITGGQYESTAQKISIMTGQHLALDAVAARSLWKRWIRSKIGVPMSVTEKIAERAAIALLLVDAYQALTAAQNEYQTCITN